MLFFLCSGFLTSVSALIYPVTNRARPCFVEEVEAQTQAITGAYLWHQHPLNGETKLQWVLRAPSHAVVATLELESNDHANVLAQTDSDLPPNMVKALGIPISFPLSSGNAKKELGPYHLCLEVDPPISGIQPENPILVSIDIDQAAVREIRNELRDAEELKEVLGGMDTKGNSPGITSLQKLGKRVLDLRREVDRVSSNMEYQLSRMNRMQQTGESTFTRVWVMATITSTVMCLVVYAQFKWISRTIVKRKLV